MKKTRFAALSLVLLVSLLSCKDSTKDKQAAAGAQQIELLVDGLKKTTDSTPIISAVYTSPYLLLGYLSEHDNFQLTISAHVQDLKTGTYQVYDCKAASECNDQTPDKNQIAQFGPYPRNPMPALYLFRTAYNAPKLGLKPLVLTISSITDEQEAGNPNKTKRIEGQLSGNLAHVEQQQGGVEWHVVGKTTEIKGAFSVLCNMK